jgi:predicted peroxiredoxin
MEKFLLVLTRGLEDPTHVIQTFQLAKVAKEKCKDVNIFLTDDAVLLTKPEMADHVKAPTGYEAAAYFSFDRQG